MWTMESSNSDRQTMESSDSHSQTVRVDMRMCVPDDEFVKLLSVLRNSSSDSVLQGLKDTWRTIPGTSQQHGAKIALRMTQGPSNACINFHCDGAYATGTVQIALNDESEYKGG